MKCDDRKWSRSVRRAGLPILALAAAAMTACGGTDEPIGGATEDASSDGRVTPDARIDAASDGRDVAIDAADAASDGRDVAIEAADGNADGQPIDGTADASSPDGGADANSTDADASSPDADGATADGGDVFGGRVLVAKTNFVVTEVATIDLANRYVVSSGGFLDGDSVPRVSNGRSFVLERTNDQMMVLDSEGVTTRTIQLRQDGGPTQNPHDVVLIPGTSTAFVPLYNTGRVAVVDVDAGTVTSTIDLSSFAAADDSDHSPDIDGALYVPATGLVYFTLQRIDTTHFPIVCPTVASLIVAVDPATGQVVAGDGGTSPIELSFISPSSMAYDAATGRLLVLSNGCETPNADGGTTRVHHGIEAITLATGKTQVLYAPTSPDFLSSLILLGEGSALVDSFDAMFTEQWNRWDLASPTLGAALANVPDGAIRETGDTLLGVRDVLDADGGAAGYDVVRYRVSTDSSSLAVSNPYAAPYPFVSGLAYVP